MRSRVQQTKPKSPAPAKPNHAKIPSNTNSTHSAQPLNTKKIIPDNPNLKVDLKIQNDHVIVDITGANVSKKKINIFDAVNAKDFGTINLYVKAGGDVNVKNASGYTPLMQGIQNGWSANEVKKMLDNMPGIDLKLCSVNQVDLTGSKHGLPLDMAIKKNDFELVKVIVEYAGIITHHKETASFIPCIHGNFEMFKYLLSHFNKESYTESWAETAINHLANSKHRESIEQIDIILSRTKLSELYQSRLLLDFSQYHFNEKILDLLIDNKYAFGKSITNALYNLITSDKEMEFKYIVDKVNDKQPIIEMLDSLKNSSYHYDKYAHILGLKDEPGTIYIADVLDSKDNGNLDFKDNVIKVDVTACQHGQCVHVQADVNPLMPKIVEGIVI